MLPFLLRRSCAAYPSSRALESRLAELYGASLQVQVSKEGETHRLSLCLSAIEDRFAFTRGESVSRDGAALLEELLFRPRLEDGVFPADAVELEKRLLRERLEAEQGYKRLYALRRCEELMCAGEAYGLNAYGTPEAIDALTPEDMVQAWQNLLRCARMQITLVAAGDGAAVEATFRAAFAGLAREPVTLGSEFIPAAGEPRFFSETLPVEQANLVMGLRTGMHDPDDHNYATRVMTSLFGGGVYSKLFLIVREQKSLCYYCQALAVRFKGLMIIASGVDTAKAEEARAAILEQLELMKTGDFTDEELDTTKRSMCDKSLSVADTPETLAEFYATGLLTEEYPSLQERCRRVNAVTREEVIAAAQLVSLDTVYLLAAEKEGETE
jgi:predicted Zn-dependent peptidase